MVRDRIGVTMPVVDGTGTHWAYLAGLKNTVPVDCCERKILFWQDVNSNFVRARTSQPAGLKPAERAH